MWKRSKSRFYIYKLQPKMTFKRADERKRETRAIRFESIALQRLIRLGEGGVVEIISIESRRINIACILKTIFVIQERKKKLEKVVYKVIVRV